MITPDITEIQGIIFTCNVTEILQKGIFHVNIIVESHNPFWIVYSQKSQVFSNT